MLSNVSIFGIYFAPFAFDVVLIAIVYYFVRKVLAKFNVFKYVWHANLFEFSLYICMLSGYMLIRYT